MNTVDIYISFPSERDWAYNKLRKHFDCVEDVEKAFGIEFSCGDGKFLSDFYQWTTNNEGLKCVVSDEDLLKYDGNVCLKTPPRLNALTPSDTIKQLKANKDYRFTIKYFEKTGEEVYYINKQKRSQKLVRY